MPTITCEIGPQLFDNIFCDLGSSVNIMSKVIFQNLLGCILLPTFMRLQMADQTIWFPEGVAKDILVKIQHEYALPISSSSTWGRTSTSPSSWDGHSWTWWMSSSTSGLARSIYSSLVRGSNLLWMAIKITCSRRTRNRRRNLAANPTGGTTKASRPKRPNGRRNLLSK